MADPLAGEPRYMTLIASLRRESALHSLQTVRLFVLTTFVGAIMLACGGATEKVPASTSTPVPAPPCPAGSIRGSDDECTPVGIQECAEIFIKEDGLCHPSIKKY